MLFEGQPVSTTLSLPYLSRIRFRRAKLIVVELMPFPAQNPPFWC